MSRIRPANVADAAALLSIYAPYVQETPVSFETQVPTVEEFAQRIAKALERWAWLVMEEGGEPVGYAYGSAHRERAAYRYSTETSVYVAPQARGRGHAARLYAALFDGLAQRGYCNALAVIVLPNDPSVRLHEAMGFTPVGVIRRAGWKFGAWHDVAWYQRALREAPLD